MSFVSLERLYAASYPTKTFLKQPMVAIILSILTMCVIFGMHLYEIFYYTVQFESKTNSTICVIDYSKQHGFWTVFNRVNVLINYIVPFLLQFVSILLLLIALARKKKRVQNTDDALIKQFKTNKELFITPTILILSALPPVILSFNFQCKELNQSWQRYMLLIAYFLSYSPQILGFILHVLPSTLYKKEFSYTANTISRRINVQ
ncbi:unnamed protein product [Didymodactylos carnosus]|uniref:G-protein coupled receptors family 1 profile domain-containing protein n=1 Tax=Didymodactylos carnosus TaxID=1234261 RepID=A0A815SC72_9BILA|nr:unnamed protein product [Didymodactylos carnosus]CAF1639739.1 unnamed protein product [Didymodactylos carnosus]CAF4352569.1 unnamed protein product [Didymodactylos carnosus]CAF4474422.1 unnamed protein product [Didymodactylos carnosus]